MAVSLQLSLRQVLNNKDISFPYFRIGHNRLTNETDLLSWCLKNLYVFMVIIKLLRKIPTNML